MKKWIVAGLVFLLLLFGLYVEFVGLPHSHPGSNPGEYEGPAK